MGEVHSRSTNLKLALAYEEWDLLATVCRTITKGLLLKGQRDTARQTKRLEAYIDDILAALRAEGHV